jgi:hypothetical protein
MNPPSSLAYGALGRAASAASAAGQNRYLRAVQIRLVALIVAAVGGALNWRAGTVDVWAWIALVAFLIALGAEIVLLATHPDQQWYDGRAAAESAKTLAWRYAVGGAPFTVGLAPKEARSAYLLQLSAVADTLKIDFFPIPADDSATQITAEMEEVRQKSFADRKARYRDGRVRDQRDWYKARAGTAERHARRFLLAAIVLEVFGVLAAAFRAADIIHFDLLGVVSAIVAGTAAWAQTRQYGATAKAYAVAANELSSIETRAELIDEADWPQFVSEAEGAISREHSLWTASRRL